MGLMMPALRFMKLKVPALLPGLILGWVSKSGNDKISYHNIKKFFRETEKIMHKFIHIFFACRKIG